MGINLVNPRWYTMAMRYHRLHTHHEVRGLYLWMHMHRLWRIERTVSIR